MICQDLSPFQSLAILSLYVMALRYVILSEVVPCPLPSSFKRFWWDVTLQGVSCPCSLKSWRTKNKETQGWKSIWGSSRESWSGARSCSGHWNRAAQEEIGLGSLEHRNSYSTGDGTMQCSASTLLRWFSERGGLGVFEFITYYVCYRSRILWCCWRFWYVVAPVDKLELHLLLSWNALQISVLVMGIPFVKWCKRESCNIFIPAAGSSNSERSLWWCV